MARREPISDETRRRVLDAIKAGGHCRAVAREFGVSPAYVSKLAKELPGDAFDRAKTQQAATARRFDAKAAREQAVEQLYSDFQRFRSRCWDEYTSMVVTNSGPELITTRTPSIRDQREAITAAAICLDKALVLERHDDTGGAEVGKTMVNDLFGALGMAYHRIIAEESQLDAVTGREVSRAEQDEAKGTAVKAAEAQTSRSH